jgi:N-acetylglucosamine kinase-like BadF-type ATPase
MVLIAGTGSYCALLNSIDSDFSNTTSVELIGSGGWGNLLGDQGSGKTRCLAIVK